MKRSSRIEEGSVAALGVSAGYYLVTQVMRPRRRVVANSTERVALKSLMLGQVGNQTVIARRAEVIKVLAHILPLIVVTPLRFVDTQSGVTVLERPLIDVPPSASLKEGPLAEIYSTLSIEEDAPNDGASLEYEVPSDQLLSDVARMLSPDQGEDEVEAEVQRVRTRMSRPLTPRERLRDLQTLEKSLDADMRATKTSPVDQEETGTA